MTGSPVQTFGMQVKFTTQPGMADALAALLLQAARGLDAFDDCLLYMVSHSPSEPDVVWVTEAWASREAHDASLRNEEALALIQQARPLLAGAPQATELQPLGGKGL